MPDKISARRSPWYSNLAASATQAVGAEGVAGSNAITVAVALKGGDGLALRRRAHVSWYVSTDPGGNGVAASAPSGSVTQGTNGKVYTADSGKTGFLTTTAGGLCDVAVTDSGTATLYLCLRMPDGSLDVSTLPFA